MQYVIDGRAKFMWLPRIDVEPFYDKERDPGECYDLIDDPDRQDEIAQWRGYLLQELAARDCGWLRDGALVCPPGEPLISLYKNVRWQGDT